MEYFLLPYSFVKGFQKGVGVDMFAYIKKR